MKLSCRIVHVERTPVYLGKDSLRHLDKLVATARPRFDKVFLLTDEATAECCLPALREGAASIAGYHHLQVKGGEVSKSFGNAVSLWTELASAGATRHSLMINLGGGVVSDLGGFVAAGYQRGIRYVNIPTSLIGQVDAAIGGKTGINLDMVKNQVGFFHNPLAVFIHTGFLKTLPPRHFRSGFAEIVKSILTGDGRLWKRLLAMDATELLTSSPVHRFMDDLIRFTVTYKVRIVREDYREKRLRKVLNFGHTAGHAYETLSHRILAEPLYHGEAVAAGMMVAALLSMQKAGLPETDFTAITGFMMKHFAVTCIASLPVGDITDTMLHDKKRRSGHIEFTLIRKPGEPLLQVRCTENEIVAALETVRDIAAAHSAREKEASSGSAMVNGPSFAACQDTDTERLSP